VAEVLKGGLWLCVDSGYAQLILSITMNQKLGFFKNPRSKKFFLRVFILLATFLIFYLDCLTGEELTFYIFYIPSIMLMAWYFGSRDGWLMVVLTGLLWVFAQWHVEHPGRFLLLIWNAAIRIATFSIICWMTLAIRLKEQKLEEASKELARSNHELETFAFKAAHDLQSPLATILGYTELLDEKYNSSADVESKDFTGRILKNIERMRIFIRSLLDYSRVMKIETTVPSVDLNKTILGVVDNLASLVKEKEAKITYDPLPEIAMNPGLAGLLFQNLIGNALKYCETKPCVHISGVLRGKEWIFSVKDNGIGIPPEDLKRVFIMFEKLTTRKQYSGSGIGLATCQKIVERYHGRIWVDSQPGQGSTFFFTFPAA